MTTPDRGGALAPGSAGYRALKIAVVVMGVMIVAGTVLLGVIASRRLSGLGGDAAGTLVLDEPPGTRIVGIAAAGDRLAVHVSGGGPDRVVLIDPARMAVTGRIGTP